MEPDLRGFPGKLSSGLNASTGVASAAGRAIGLAVAAGAAAAAVGLKQVISIGIDYQNSLNTLQAVTGATADQMSRAGQVAKELGSDMSLPATSAVDAAAAMTELAKGGLSVDQAMTAAKGTLQLAAAAQIDAASAAQIQSQALNTFALSADDAGHVADVLANAANSAAGEITDFAAALQAGGSVASQFGLSIDETATALALFANNGIIGSDAGTLLKSSLLALTDTGKPAQRAISDLGLAVFDAKGEFVGFPAIFEQLRVASQNMTQEQYATATSVLFGSDAVRLAGIAAKSTGTTWDEMAVKIGRAGGASEVAAAKTKGLGGAVEGLKSQLETAALAIFDAIDEPLENLVRGAAEAIPKVQRFLEDLGSGAQRNLQPFADAARNVYDALVPVVRGIMDVAAASGEGGGALSLAGDALRIVGTAAEFVTGLLQPLGSTVGFLLSLFSELPAPIQSAALALLAFKVGPSLLGGLRSGLAGVRSETDGAARSTGLFGSAVRGAAAPVTGLVGGMRQLAGELRVQRGLAAANGESLTRLGAAQAAFETSTVGAVAAVRNFRDDLRAVRAGAAATGAPISSLSAAVGVLAERSPSVAAMAGSFRSTSTAVQGFATAAGAAGRSASVALGERLAQSVSRGVESVLNLRSSASSAASTLRTALGVAAINAAEAIKRIPAAVSSAASTLKTGIGVAAINAAESLRSMSSAVSSAAQTLKTGIGVAAINAAESLRRLPAAALSAGQSLGRGLRDGVTAAAAAVRNLPSTVSAAMTATGQAVASGLRSIPDHVRTAFAGIGAGVDRGITALGRFSATVAGVGASVGTGLLRAGGSLVSFLGGPWGVALAVAGVALSVFSSRQEESAARAAEHKAQLDGLAGTLDKYSGAVTAATVAEKAQQLSTQLLSDGHTTALQAVKSLGISVADYTQASLGNADALGRVQAQLATHTRATIESSDAYRSAQPQLAKYGVTLDDLTAAAQGSAPAISKIDAAMKEAGKTSPLLEVLLRKVVDGILATGGASAQLATELGISNGALAQIQEQTRLASEAANDFGARLGSLAPGLGALRDGAAPAKELGVALDGLAASARQSASAAGEAQAGMYGAAAGAAAAEQSMQKSREAFVAAATGAGLTAEQAARLADQIGLVPAAARTQFETNAAAATADIQGVKAALDGVPLDKPITIRTLSDEARAKLTELGAVVTTLPDGTIQVLANTDAARAALDAAVADGNARVATVTIAGNSGPLTLAITQGVQLADGSTGTVTLEGNPNPLTGKINGTVAYGNGQTATITIDGNQAPSDGKINATVQYGNGQTSIIRVNADTAAANAAIDRAARPRTMTITATTIYGPSTGAASAARKAQGGIVSAMHDGGVVGMAGGGVRGRRLTHMRGGVAQVVPPNTWRIIGDRIVDDESYIPINGSARSRRIFEETARRMGYSVARMYADGGVAAAAIDRARVIAAGRVALATSANPDIAAALLQLRRQLADVRRDVQVTVNAYNPVAEKASATAARKLRTLMELGSFD